MIRRRGVPKYKVKALANLQEMRDLGISEKDIRQYLTPRQIHGYHTGLFMERSKAVPNMHNVALGIVQSKSLGRRVAYRSPNQEYWWQRF